MISLNFFRSCKHSCQNLTSVFVYRLNLFPWFGHIKRWVWQPWPRIRVFFESFLFQTLELLYKQLFALLLSQRLRLNNLFWQNVFSKINWIETSTRSSSCTTALACRPSVGRAPTVTSRRTSPSSGLTKTRRWSTGPRRRSRKPMPLPDLGNRIVESWIMSGNGSWRSNVWNWKKFFVIR